MRKKSNLARKIMTILVMTTILANLLINFASIPVSAVSAPSSVSVIESRFRTIENGTYGANRFFRNDQNRSCTFNSPRSGACHGKHDSAGFNYTNDAFCNCKVATADIAGTAGGIQCFGYMRYVFYQLFGLSLPTSYNSNLYTLSSSNNITQVGQTTSANATNTKTILSQARIGDVIQARTSSGGMHSMVVKSVNNSEVTILDANTNGDCRIHNRTMTWSNFASRYPAFTLYRSRNYPTVTLPPPPPPPITSLQFRANAPTSGILNLRQQPNTTSTVLAGIPHNTVLVVNEIRGWGKITFQGRTGWISLEHTIIVGQQFRVNAPTSGILNLRQQPNTTSAVLAGIPHNTILDVNDISGWGRVTFQSRTGWISLDHAVRVR